MLKNKNQLFLYLILFAIAGFGCGYSKRMSYSAIHREVLIKNKRTLMFFTVSDTLRKWVDIDKYYIKKQRGNSFIVCNDTLWYIQPDIYADFKVDIDKIIHLEMDSILEHKGSLYYPTPSYVFFINMEGKITTAYLTWLNNREYREVKQALQNVITKHSIAFHPAVVNGKSVNSIMVYKYDILQKRHIRSRLW
jgi:hypothetical protein